MRALNTIAVIIAIAGSVIIIWGTFVTAVLFLKSEWSKLFGKNEKLQDVNIRYRISSYLLLGLDFMLAADIIHTIHNPVLNELYILAIIVAIRSVISYFLHREMYRSVVNTNVLEKSNTEPHDNTN